MKSNDHKLVTAVEFLATIEPDMLTYLAEGCDCSAADLIAGRTVVFEAETRRAALLARRLDLPHQDSQHGRFPPALWECIFSCETAYVPAS